MPKIIYFLFLNKKAFLSNQRFIVPKNKTKNIHILRSQFQELLKRFNGFLYHATNDRG